MPEVVATTPSSPFGTCVVVELDIGARYASLESPVFAVAAAEGCMQRPLTFIRQNQASFQPVASLERSCPYCWVGFFATFAVEAFKRWTPKAFNRKVRKETPNSVQSNVALLARLFCSARGYNRGHASGMVHSDDVRSRLSRLLRRPA